MEGCKPWQGELRSFLPFETGTFLCMAKISKSTWFLFFMLSLFAGLSFILAYYYYGSINKSEDPRIIATKYLFEDYEELIKENKRDLALVILDSIEAVFTRVPGYAMSYEMGIVYNNKGSVFLNKALALTHDSLLTAGLLKTAQGHIDTAIAIYSRWLDAYGKLSLNELEMAEIPYFNKDDAAFHGKNHDKIFKKRINDLLLAQKETRRRLSVSYTNKGIVLRHQYRQEEAADYYIKAISMWKENYTAKNNFNILMGKPPEDRSIIDQLFPPEKNKFED